MAGATVNASRVCRRLTFYLLVLMTYMYEDRFRTPSVTPLFIVRSESKAGQRHKKNKENLETNSYTDSQRWVKTSFPRRSLCLAVEKRLSMMINE